MMAYGRTAQKPLDFPHVITHGSAGTPAVPEGSGESKTPRRASGQRPTITA